MLGAGGVGARGPAEREPGPGLEVVLGGAQEVTPGLGCFQGVLLWVDF